MDLKQLYYVVTIAQMGTMTRAAQEIHISQSALSFSYRNLEEELGILLFEKRGRNLYLTPEGKIFCQKAAGILEQVGELKRCMSHYRDSRLNRIIIAAEAVDFSNETVMCFSPMYPDLKFEQLRLESSEMQEALQSGQVDLAVSLQDMESSIISSELLLDEPMLVLLASNSPMAQERSLRMNQLRGIPLVTLKEGYYMNTLIHNFYQQAWILPGPTQAVGDPETIPYLVSRGIGISFIPESVYNTMPKQTLSDCVAVTLEDNFCRRKVYLSMLKNKKMSSNCQQYVRFLRCFGEQTQREMRFPKLEQIQL